VDQAIVSQVIVGIGTGLIRSLQDEAIKAGFPIHLHVGIFNSAQRLYERLGFSKVGVNGIHYKMEWKPSLST